MQESKDSGQDIFYHGVFNLGETPKVELPPVGAKDDEKEKDLSTMFENERIEWKEKLIGMAEKMRSIRNMSDLQVDLYSQRQVVLERSHYLQSLLARVHKNYKKVVASKTMEYMTGDRRLKVGETTILVDAYVADTKEKIDLIEAQVEYMHETKKNLDNMIYGLSHRIQFEQYRNVT